MTRTARARVREELRAEILAAAGEELVDAGAAALSLRAVARRLDMVPSALYRYFDSRDGLLTALIVESYQALGEAAEVAGRDWLAICRAVRRWGHANPQRWALLYGSPVPGYEAPSDTVAPAMQVPALLASLPRTASAMPPAPADMTTLVAPMEKELFPGSPPEAIVGGVMAWTQLIGMVSLELFGHYAGGTTEFEPVFEYAMTAAGALAGVAQGEH